MYYLKGLVLSGTGKRNGSAIPPATRELHDLEPEFCFI